VCFGSKNEVARFEKYLYPAATTRFKDVQASLV
jgi:hypothetical protein